MTHSSMVLQTVGGLEVLKTEGPHKNLILMLHGYGANAQDLAPLSSEITAPQSTGWIFPNGPSKVDLGMGFSGRAWFPIDMVEHDRAAREGRGVDYSKKSSRPAQQACEKILTLIEALACPADQLIIGGFSQGAMLSVEVALSLPKKPKALLLMSGVLVDEENWSKRAKEKKGLRFFQSHGIQDQVLPYGGGEKLHDVLQTAGWEGEFLSFRGGHEIPFKVIQQMSQFISRLN